jgi:hypothetical protein
VSKAHTDRLESAIDGECAAVRRAIDRLSDLDCESEKWEKIEDLVRDVVRDLRMTEALFGPLSRLVKGRSAREIHEAFGSPGDYGYDTPIGAALYAIYQAKVK